MTKTARILAALRAEPAPLTSFDIADELGDQVHKVNGLLRHLEIAGRCERVGMVSLGTGKPFNLWRAKESR